jgi:1-acyl-sn-glycerol-3-phosphate acyltransferase
MLSHPPTVLQMCMFANKRIAVICPPLTKHTTMFRLLCSFVFHQLMRWRIEGNFPFHLPKFVIAVAPHTSNWDFPIGIMVRSILRHADLKFVGKSSLFRPPFGALFRWLGGFPVDRRKNTNFVDSVVEIFNREPEFRLTIAPEGTRKKVDKLKTGFYYIAVGAQVPIVLVQFDYANKRVFVADPFYPTGNAAEDIEHITDFFRGVRGFHPENGVG